MRWFRNEKQRSEIDDFAILSLARLPIFQVSVARDEKRAALLIPPLPHGSPTGQCFTNRLDMLTQPSGGFALSTPLYTDRIF